MFVATQKKIYFKKPQNRWPTLFFKCAFHIDLLLVAQCACWPLFACVTVAKYYYVNTITILYICYNNLVLWYDNEDQYVCYKCAHGLKIIQRCRNSSCLSWWSCTTWCNSSSSCMNACVCVLAQVRVFYQMKASQVPHSWHLHWEKCNLKWDQAWGKHVVFTHPSAATVKFAHSHAFFVSLTFHVEAKA